MFKEPCKPPYLCVYNNLDLLKALECFDVDLTTSVEEAMNHFAVGKAFAVTRCFFVCVPESIADQRLSDEQ